MGRAIQTECDSKLERARLSATSRMEDCVSAPARVKKAIFSAAVIIFAASAGCQMTPTKVKEVHHREYEVLVDKAQKPLSLSEGVKVLDARSAFAYGLNHVTGAYNFTWEKLAEDSKTAEIIRDKNIGARRLALYGLTPTTPVIVVDDALKGGAEAGQVAWLLLYFGFQDVQTASVDLFRNFWTPNPTPDPENAPGYPGNVRDELLVGKEEFGALAADAKGRLAKRIFILDTRTEAEYLKASKKISKNAPDIGAINVPWTEFYTKDGRPNSAIRAKLGSLGIQDGDQIILRAGDRALAGTAPAAAYSLIALGFKKVRYSPN